MAADGRQCTREIMHDERAARSMSRHELSITTNHHLVADDSYRFFLSIFIPLVRIEARILEGIQTLLK